MKKTMSLKTFERLFKNADEWYGKWGDDFITIVKDGKERKLPRKLLKLHLQSIIQKNQTNSLPL
jgi:hypothetical protein